MLIDRIALAFAAALALAGMAATTEAAAQSAPGQGYVIGEVKAAAPLYNSLPKGVVEAGGIVTGVIIAAPPSQFIDPETKELRGFNIDLMKALSGSGVPFKAVPTDFSSFIPGLQAKRFDMVAAFIADVGPARRSSISSIITRRRISLCRKEARACI